MIRAGTAALLLSLFLPLPKLAALDARQIFERVSPSTVLIESLDSGGSGVFLSDRGLILTNYHVVATNIDLKVRARVRFGTKVVVTEIDDVKIVKVHPTYDLAILQAKPPANGAFIPAFFLPRQASLPPGSKCFALGNPGGPEGKQLELSITEGIVSSASRMVEGKEFIQFSAAINPGNSGGPLCDDSGRVIGISTWKTTQTEGIGFAIPTQSLNMTDFVEPKARHTNPILANEANSAAAQFVRLGEQAAGREREAYLAMAAEGFRVAILADGTSPMPYTNLCVTFRLMGDQPTARKYATAAYALAPDDAQACHLFGLYKIEENSSDPKTRDQCVEIWFHGSLEEKNKEPAGHCAEDIAIAFINQKKDLAAAYMLRWSDVLMGSASPSSGSIPSLQCLGRRFRAISLSGCGFSRRTRGGAL